MTVRSEMVAAILALEAALVSLPDSGSTSERDVPRLISVGVWLLPPPAVLSR